jgi:hypothetical protein
MSVSPLDFTEFLSSTGPLLPDLQGFHSQMAKVEIKTLEKIANFEFEGLSKTQFLFFNRLEAIRVLILELQ